MSKKEKAALWAALVYMGIMMIGMYVMKHHFQINYDQPQMVSVLVYFMPFSAGSALIFYYKFFRGTAFKKLKLNFWIIEFFIAAIILAALQIYFGNYQGKDMSLVWTIVGTTFMVGIGEEMLFRGIIFNAFKEKHGVYAAVLISAVIFGALHITNILGGESLSKAIFQCCSAALTGIVFAWVYYKTENLIPTMLYHWVWDMFLILGLYVHVDQTASILMFQNIFSIIASIVLLFICIKKIIQAKKTTLKL
ncbi:CPBP family intramembrane glutamic endopeptidase [Ligilactobacillus ceti]|uniref:CAAX prenyl protease 2/Lysostaphin resistance protein A-like domain-containing protein n=1 Tax=Ligilactobacillus ceti DSM 22408 TaxID=1122146 RepID=A0A0R2KQC6_9LACO|nr:CPBP family intramembrane glutamic endopeptidase [Ligilactobacillus ceti]KRN88826.1 hypothetical protein IV53_GL000796 [Ligilactobacillus ceti DSM 22408]